MELWLAPEPALFQHCRLQFLKSVLMLDTPCPIYWTTTGYEALSSGFLFRESPFSPEFLGSGLQTMYPTHRKTVARHLLKIGYDEHRVHHAGKDGRAVTDGAGGDPISSSGRGADFGISRWVCWFGFVAVQVVAFGNICRRRGFLWFACVGGGFFTGPHPPRFLWFNGKPSREVRWYASS